MLMRSMALVLIQIIIFIACYSLSLYWNRRAQSGLKWHIKTIWTLPPERIKENRNTLQHMWVTFASETIINSPTISILLLLLIIIIILLLNIDLHIPDGYFAKYTEAMTALSVMNPLLNALYCRGIANHLSRSFWPSQSQTAVQPFS